MVLASIYLQIIFLSHLCLSFNLSTLCFYHRQSNKHICVNYCVVKFVERLVGSYSKGSLTGFHVFLVVLRKKSCLT